MNRLPPERRAEVLLMLCQGASMRGVARASGVSVNTAAKLLAEAGAVCGRLHDESVRGVRADRVECLKSWSRDCGTADGVWTWSAVAADSDLILAWHVGGRSPEDVRRFVADIGARSIHGAPTLSEADRGRLAADDAPFALDLAGHRIEPPDDRPGGVAKRIQTRRFTRLRNAYSKKFETFRHMVEIYSFWSNFIKIDGSAKTPAMIAGLAERPWSPADIFALIDRPARRAA